MLACYRRHQLSDKYEQLRLQVVDFYVSVLSVCLQHADYFAGLAGDPTVTCVLMLFLFINLLCGFASAECCGFCLHGVIVPAYITSPAVASLCTYTRMLSVCVAYLCCCCDFKM